MKYHRTCIGEQTYFLLDLDQKEVEKRIIEDMENGVDVYYDRRWEVTDLLTDWLEKHYGVYADKHVLVLGAGIGAETLVLGRLAKKLYLNDLSSTALELCGEQLEKNGVNGFECLEGRYEEIELPTVDLVVGSFLVYNKETHAAMKAFMLENRCKRHKILLLDETLQLFNLSGYVSITQQNKNRPITGATRPTQKLQRTRSYRHQ